MGFFLKALFVGLLAIGAYVTFVSLNVEEIKIEEKGWFGAGAFREDKLTIEPFKIDVPESVLEDLKSRLTHARVGHETLEDSDDFYYGFNTKYLATLKDYWLNKYDWRKQEKILNSFNHFKTEIEGMQVHYIHQKPAAGYKHTYPLLIVHGWPGNVFEFYKIIPLLTDPKKHGIQSDVAFEVIAPSIPGYGWSSAPKKTGFSQTACSRVFRKLMDRLKFKKFFLQGGDWGALVTSNLARLYPDRIYALHLNMLPLGTGSIRAFAVNILASWFPSILSSKELQKTHSFGEKFKTIIIESGYMHLQATKPDTVGTALNDSPLGLAAYIIEKFSTWTNLSFRGWQNGGLEKKFTKDELLTIVMIYWINGNIANSQRFYRECFLDDKNQALLNQYLSVPTAHASGLNEMFDRTPIEASKALFNVTHYTEIHDMGHFACFEQPKAMADDIFDFVKSLGY